MAVLAVALQRRQWELAALYILLGVVSAAALLPPESVEELLAVLDEPVRGPRGARRDRRS